MGAAGRFRGILTENGIQKRLFSQVVEILEREELRKHRTKIIRCSSFAHCRIFYAIIQYKFYFRWNIFMEIKLKLYLAVLLKFYNWSLCGASLILKKGTIVDSAIIKAPTSTKNREKKRDPEANSTKKGNTWHFRYSDRSWKMKMRLINTKINGYVMCKFNTLRNVHIIKMDLPL